MADKAAERTTYEDYLKTQKAYNFIPLSENEWNKWQEWYAEVGK